MYISRLYILQLGIFCTFILNCAPVQLGRVRKSCACATPLKDGDWLEQFVLNFSWRLAFPLDFLFPVYLFAWVSQWNLPNRPVPKFLPLVET